jgi:protein-tyrosine-phosphatase/predicted ATP-grasp superfamily ATP-dependent carboligase
MTLARPRKALVLGDDLRSLLGVVRSLGRGNVEVHVGWHPADSLVRHSRHVSRAHALPAYSADDDAWKTALIALMKQEAYDLVVPCSDPVLIPLQTHRAALEPHGRIYLLDDAVYRTVFDKFAVNALARAGGVCLARECMVGNRSEAEVIKASFQLPVVLKPRASFDPRRVGERQEVRKAYAWREFDTLLDAMLEEGPVAVQENFIGQGVGVELLLKEGKPLLEFQHVRLHEPLRGGGSCYRKGVAVSPDLREAALAILGPLKYTGVAMVEFKVNPVTGAWVFIEVNGRFWGSLPLAIASGADFPLALFEMLVEGRTSFPEQVRHGLCCRSWTGDLQWQVANLRADRRDPTLATRPLPAVVGETVANVVTLRERSDTFALDDPIPGVVEIGRLASSVVGSLVRKAWRRMLQPAPIRRRLARRARRALRHARSVLFVCKGNICRSPFAHQLVTQVVRPAQACVSAGYYPAADRPSPAAAIAAAAGVGVDLSAHRSVQLTEAHVFAADAIFVFDEENYNRLAADYACRAKLHLVGALCPEGPLWIADPYGQDVQGFEQTYGQIRDAIIATYGRADPRASGPPRRLNMSPPDSPRLQPVADNAR